MGLGICLEITVLLGQLGTTTDAEVVRSEKDFPLENVERGEKQCWWASLVEFAVHIFVGTLIFALIAILAVGLDILLKLLSTLGVSVLILTGLTVAKLTLFGTDLLLFLIYLVNTSWLFVLNMEWRKHQS